MTGRKQKRSPKQSRYGGKQRHGHSRQSYFSQARARVAANKARRIAREKARQAACAEKRKADVVGSESVCGPLDGETLASKAA